MTKLPPSPFYCPICGAKYKIVRIEVPDATPADGEISCTNCGAALPEREGAFVLAYLLVERGGELNADSAGVREGKRKLN